MRTFAWFFGLIVLGFAGMAVLTYPVWLLVHPTLDFGFHKIGTRVAELTLAVGFFVVARHLGLANRNGFGYAAPRKIFLREMFVGLGLGVLTMLPVVAAIALLDLRDLKAGVTLNAQMLFKIALTGALRGFAVAFIEETFLRGCMYAGMSREMGARATIILTSLIYSATHFIGRIKIPAEQITPGSGFDLLAGSFGAFADPWHIADAFLCLFAIGVLLGMVRKLTGHIGACIGLHAGWVWVIAFVLETSRPDRSRPWSFLFSDPDFGVVGWLTLAWTGVIAVWLYRYYSKRRARPIPRSA